MAQTLLLITTPQLLATAAEDSELVSDTSAIDLTSTGTDLILGLITQENIETFTHSSLSVRLSLLGAFIGIAAFTPTGTIVISALTHSVSNTLAFFKKRGEEQALEDKQRQLVKRREEFRKKRRIADLWKVTDSAIHISHKIDAVSRDLLREKTALADLLFEFPKDSEMETYLEKSIRRISSEITDTIKTLDELRVDGTHIETTLQKIREENTSDEISEETVENSTSKPSA